MGGEVDPDASNKDMYECIKVYFYKFRTPIGYATLEMRNSSNGYYGGSMEFAYPDHNFNDDLSFRVLTEDF